MLGLIYLAYGLVCVALFKGLWRAPWSLLNSLCLMIALIFPGLGLVAACWWRARYRPVDAQALLATHTAARYTPIVNFADVRAQAVADRDVEAIKPALHTPNAQGHTQAIIQLQHHQVPHLGAVLTTALESSHVDTVHYAATTWVNQQTRLTEAVQKAQGAYHARPSVMAGRKVLAAYAQLLDSELLAAQIAMQTRNEQVAMCQALTQAYPGEWQFWAALVDAYLAQDALDTAQKVCKQAHALGFNNAPLVYRQLRLAHARRDFPAVAECLATLTTLPQLDLTRQQQEQIAILRGNFNATG